MREVPSEVLAVDDDRDGEGPRDVVEVDVWTAQEAQILRLIEMLKELSFPAETGSGPVRC